MDEVVGVPEVRSAVLVTGRYDLVVHVVVLQDTRRLKDLAFDQFTNRPGFARIETSMILMSAGGANCRCSALSRRSN
ncbi:Lrp/AsnC ligand binding domain-containing protein [Roseixanthobacter glucoisosaccharinicivorans]|uniref:Lrp/AsnC ligand binding domain-containing protein n=1 Tax=Roseixanthobacter glucoisosaccharinicivorans TaxID=3119923 RepID=UPI00372D6730